jgi:hypothetical protein
MVAKSMDVKENKALMERRKISSGSKTNAVYDL